MINEGVYWIDADGKAHPCIFEGDSDFDMNEVTYDFGKYRWHDLRKNPSDLPEERTEVLVYISYGYVDGITTVKCESSAYLDDFGNWRTGNNRNVIGVTAWRYIEPFEEEE